MRRPVAATATLSVPATPSSDDREVGPQRPAPARSRPAVGEQQDDQRHQHEGVFPGRRQQHRQRTQRQRSVVQRVVEVGVLGAVVSRLYRERYGDQQPAHRVARFASRHDDPDGRERQHEHPARRGVRDIRRGGGELVAQTLEQELCRAARAARPRRAPRRWPARPAASGDPLRSSAHPVLLGSLTASLTAGNLASRPFRDRYEVCGPAGLPRLKPRRASVAARRRTSRWAGSGGPRASARGCAPTSRRCARS